jgi:DNA repair protein RadC
MKTSNRIHRNGATKPALVQVKMKTSFAPAEFKIVRLRECPVDNPMIETPPEVVAFWRAHVVSAPWFRDEKENLCVFLLDARHCLTGFELVCQGTLDTLLMHPREVLRPATIHNAAAIIIAHNHPSGDPTPSLADIKATRDLIESAGLMKIEFLDHVIIGDARREKGYNSVRELGFFAADSPVKNGKDISDRPQFDQLTELETAKTQSNALSKLLADSMDHYSSNGCQFGSEEDKSMIAGIGSLVRMTNERLEIAFNSVFHAVHRKREQAAA